MRELLCTEEPGCFASANQLNAENGVMYVVWMRDTPDSPPESRSTWRRSN